MRVKLNRKKIAAGVTFELECLPEDIPVRGNAMASGDDAADREYEDEIIRRLDAGDVWAWCTVKVTARFGAFEGVSYLGCCNYRDEEDFTQPGGYFEDMEAEAFDALLCEMDTAVGNLMDVVECEGR